MRRKSKRTPNQILKDKLWKVFSEYIRRKNANYQGYVKCITCPSVKHWKEMNAGHFRHNCLDYDEKNVHVQCVACNKWWSGRLDVYADFIIKTYGLKEFNALNKRATQALAGERYEDKWLENKINYYKQQLCELN